MRFLYFNNFTLGVLRGDGVVDVSRIVREIPRASPHDLITGVIANIERYRGRLQDAVASCRPIPLTTLRIRPPLPRPGNIVCMP